MSASGSAGVLSSANQTDYYYFFANALVPWDNDHFTLSANSRVVFSGLANIAGAGTGGDANPHFNGQSVGALAEIDVWDNAGSQASTDSISFGGNDLDPYSFASSDSRLLEVTFVNQTGAAITGTLDAGVRVYGYSDASPVPEAGVGVLMLGGLTTVGIAARRRRDASVYAPRHP